MSAKITVGLLSVALCLALAALAAVLWFIPAHHTSFTENQQTEKTTTPMIRLNVFIQTTPANRAELVAVAKELVAASLTDEGCIAYDLFESATRPNELMICETWSNDETLAAHGQAPHFTKLVPRLRALGEMKTERFEF